MQYFLSSLIFLYQSATLAFVPFRAIDFESAMLIYTSLIPNKLDSNHILSDFGTNLILFYIVMCFVVVWFFRNSNDFIRIDKKSLNFVFLNNTIFDYKLIHTFFSYILFIIFFLYHLYISFSWRYRYNPIYLFPILIEIIAHIVHTTHKI